MNLMCILNLQPLHKAQSIGKPMLTMKPTKRTIAHTDATEHAYDDNTGPRGSDATERAATMEAMLQSAQLQLTTPAFDAATDDIAVGPCRLRCMKNERWMLCKMQEEIERRFRVPVSLKQFLKNTSTLDAMQVGVQQCKVRAGAPPSKQYHDALRPSRKQLMLQSTFNAKALLPKRATTRSPSHGRLQPTAVTRIYSLLYTNSCRTAHII